MTKESYLGDGVYASWDGVQIKLRAPRPFGDSEVFIDTALWSNLLKFAQLSFSDHAEKSTGEAC